MGGWRARPWGGKEAAVVGGEKGRVSKVKGKSKDAAASSFIDMNKQVSKTKGGGRHRRV